MVAKPPYLRSLVCETLHFAVTSTHVVLPLRVEEGVGRPCLADEHTRDCLGLLYECME